MAFDGLALDAKAVDVCAMAAIIRPDEHREGIFMFDDSEYYCVL
jgi:hypothetical protein